MPKNTSNIEGFDVPDIAHSEPSPVHQPVELPVVVAAPAAAAPVVVAEPEEVLPTDLKSAFELLTASSNAVVDQERDADGNQRVLTKDERTKRQKRLERVRAHVRQLQQGPPSVVMTANDLTRVHRQPQISERAARIAELAR